MLLEERRSTLGPEGSLAERRARGAVYTPPALAEWVAQLLLHRCSKPSPLILDLGCGDGALLQPFTCSRKGVRLAGIELNRAAAIDAQSSLGGKASILVGDVLCPEISGSQTLARYWAKQLKSRPDAIIMNPPWGGEDLLTKDRAKSVGLQLASGQYDTYDLFCELALQLLAPAGQFAFILPDSILLPEHEPLRKLLVSKTMISLIARLGEGIFPGVYRGCVVIVGTLGVPKLGHEVECMRLTQAERSQIRCGEPFEGVRKRVSHFVPQSRFSRDNGVHFDIDVRREDISVIKILEQSGGWTTMLDSRRGVELSKHGKIVTCQQCRNSRPAPRTEANLCPHCGSSPEALTTSTIVATAPVQGGEWHPFIVGEDVTRYSVIPRRWIKGGVRGINYKKRPLCGQDRILIRKTGIGINAAIDSSDAYTNQVVFEYVLNKKAEKFAFSYLHYILGVLCSRTLFAFHLKRGGDLEWRSHPYVTQKTLAALPIPIPTEGRQMRQAAAIADSVAKHLAQGDRDYEIEALVAGHFDLESNDLQHLMNGLHHTGNLEAMRRMRLPPDRSIQPIRVF